MSSRALRKAKGPVAVGGDAKDDESSEEDAPPPPRRNAFALLNDGGESSASEADEATPSPPKDAAPAKAKKKAKKKGKKKREEALGEEDLDLDQLIRKAQEQDRSQLPAQSADSDNLSCQADLIGEAELFRIEHRNLNPGNEMRRIFGAAIKDKEFRKLAGASAGSSRRDGRGGKLVEAKREWGPPTKTGLSMTHDVAASTASANRFRFVHSKDYQLAQLLFRQAVEAMNPDAFMAILRQSNYHIDSLLQLSEVVRINEDMQQSRDFIERAIYGCWSAFHPLFNITSFGSRLDYAQEENRGFFLALWRHLLALQARGCPRTALEFAKLIYSLDPRSDPLGVLLIIDFLAVKSKQYDYLLRLYHGLEESRNLSQLPNFNYSVALALFLRSEDDGAGSKESRAKDATDADEKLQLALTRFPSMVYWILDRCSVEPDAEIAKAGVFGLAEHNKNSKGLQQLENLYAVRTCALWKEPPVMAWLERNVRRLLAQLLPDPDRHPLFAEFRRKRRSMYKGIPLNVLRHIVVSDLREVRVNLPAEYGEAGIRSFDPLPPRDSRCDYSLDEAAAGPAGRSGFLDGLIRSLLPNFTPEAAAAADAAAVAEGRGAVGHAEALMGAMRELLANVQVAAPEREDQHQEELDPEWDDVD